MKSHENLGLLYIVSTPIGNLGDISYRALDILRSVALIAAEDTRHSKKLLTHYNIDTKLTSFHAHNEEHRCERLLERLLQGESLALISDAGTPLISDPGCLLVSRAIEQGISVVPIPGACAIIAALVASGVAADRFYFAGFIPSKEGARESRLQQLFTYTQTVVLYEAPHRLQKLLNTMMRIDPQRNICLAKELTKLHETFYRGSVESALHWWLNDCERQSGEFVVIIEGMQEQEEPQDDEKLLKVLLEDLPLKTAVKIASKLSTTAKNKLYQQALALQ